MPGIGIISNPYARVNKRDPEHNTLMWYVLGNRGQFEVTNTLVDLERVCAEFERRDVDLVGIVGGDGTVSLTLSALVQAYGPERLPKIVLLRGGTVNVVASNLGIFGKPKDVMADFLDYFHSGRPLFEMRLHTLLVNERLGFIFANGVATDFLEEFYSNKGSSLAAGAFFAQVMADGLFGGKLSGRFTRMSRTRPMQLALEGGPLSSESYSMVLASTVPKMPFGIRLYRKLSTARAEAQLVAVRAVGRPLLAQGFRAIAGRGLDDSRHVTENLFHAAALEVEAGEKYSLDGDICLTETGRIDIRVGPSFVFCSPYGKVI